MSVESRVVPASPENGAVRRERPRCPFYGFTRMSGVMMDSKGNGCGLMGGHHPCEMEMARKKPYWYSCSRSDQNAWHFTDFQTFLDTVRIFPDELHPAGLAQWDGVSLHGWFHLIADRTPS